MVAVRYLLHRGGIVHQRQFDSLERRYRSAAEAEHRPIDVKFTLNSPGGRKSCSISSSCLYTPHAHPPVLQGRYTDKWASIESTFIADARFLGEHWPHPSGSPVVRRHAFRLHLPARAALRHGRHLQGHRLLAGPGYHFTWHSSMPWASPESTC